MAWLAGFVAKHSGFQSIADLCAFDVRIGFSSAGGQGGFAIAADNLEMLGKLKADLFVDLFPPGE